MFNTDCNMNIFEVIQSTDNFLKFQNCLRSADDLYTEKRCVIRSLKIINFHDSNIIVDSQSSQDKDVSSVSLLLCTRKGDF